jgi:hypothetical protein
VRSGSTTGWGTVAAALPVLLAAAVYFPVTRSYFFADDFNCLLSIRNDDFLRFVLRPFAGHNLVVRNLVFYGSARFFGLRADLFFWQVLLTHLLNVWLLFRVLHALTASRLLASGGAALWGTSPVQLGTLGWYASWSDSSPTPDRCRWFHQWRSSWAPSRSGSTAGHAPTSTSTTTVPAGRS